MNEIKPTKSINDLLNFESDSDLGEQLTVTPTTEAEDYTGSMKQIRVKAESGLD